MLRLDNSIGVLNVFTHCGRIVGSAMFEVIYTSWKVISSKIVAKVLLMYLVSKYRLEIIQSPMSQN